MVVGGRRSTQYVPAGCWCRRRRTARLLARAGNRLLAVGRRSLGGGVGRRMGSRRNGALGVGSCFVGGGVGRGVVGGGSFGGVGSRRVAAVGNRIGCRGRTCWVGGGMRCGEMRVERMQCMVFL